MRLLTYLMLRAGVAEPAPSAVVDSGRGIPDEFGDDHRGEAVEGESPPESPVGRLRAHRAYWNATMHQIGMVCAFTLSVIDNGYQLA